MPQDAETRAFGRGVVDPAGQLVRREAAEHHRVDRADARAGQHRDQRLGHHRHVDDHAVAVADALAPQRAGEARHLILELAKVSVRTLSVTGLS